MGSFIHASNERNFQYNDRAMEEILADFYKQKAYSMKPQETFAAIVGALQEAGLAYVAHEIVKACKNENDEGKLASQSQDQQQS